MFFRERGESLSFVIFNIIISHIFPENFIEIPLAIQKIFRFTSILTIVINVSDFFKFPCFKEANDVSILKQMI